MSQHLSSVAVQAFEAEVHHAYQAIQSTLRGTVKSRMGVKGDKYTFNTMTKGAATARTGSSADVVPMGINYAHKIAILSDWEAPEYTDIYNQQEVLFSEVQELAKTIAGSLSRREDQIIIDALATTGTTAVGDGTKPLDLAAITSAAQALNKVEAPTTDRYFVVTEKGLNDLLNDSKITSADYNSVRLLMAGEIDSFMGFKWKIIGSGRSEGGLPSVTTVQKGYAYHKDSLGTASGLLKTRVDWVAHKASWLSLGMLKMGAVCIDNEGVIPVEYLK